MTRIFSLMIGHLAAGLDMPKQVHLGWVRGFSVRFGFHVLDLDLESEVVPAEVDCVGDS